MATFLPGERKPAPSSLRSILVATDLSAREPAALRRAWQLAHTHGATLRLMYVPEHGAPAIPQAAARLAWLARQCERELGRDVHTVACAGHALRDLAAAARESDLVVLPHRRERSTAAFFRGQPVLRLLRDCDRPVLVTRAAQGPHYRRILVAVDFSPASERLVQLAAGLDTRAQLELFHAICTREEARRRCAEATEQALRAWRERCLRHASDRLLTLTDSFDARRNRILAIVGRGDPGRQTVVQQEHSGADLVVIGKRRRSAWGDFLRGSVAHSVLGWGSSDVLVVPQGPAPQAAEAPSLPAGQGRALLPTGGGHAG